MSKKLPLRWQLSFRRSTFSAEQPQRTLHKDHPGIKIDEKDVNEVKKLTAAHP